MSNHYSMVCFLFVFFFIFTIVHQIKSLQATQGIELLHDVVRAYIIRELRRKSSLRRTYSSPMEYKGNEDELTQCMWYGGYSQEMSGLVERRIVVYPNI